MLSNTSEWFQRCSNSGFTEASSRVITLKSDFPEALEALFEFCYCDTYTLTFAGKGDFEIAKNEFIQHARTLVVANKYMAEGLVEHAAAVFKSSSLNRLKKLRTNTRVHSLSLLLSRATPIRISLGSIQIP